MPASPSATIVPVSDPLRRSLGAWSTMALVIGSTIGSGIFRVPSVAAAETQSVGAIALLWILGALVTLFGVLSVAEVAVMFPRPGGLYAYLREGFGPVPAFLFGWTRLLVIQPAVIGAIAMIFAAYAAAFVPLSDAGVRVVAAACIVVLSAASYRSLEWGATLQNISTAAKAIALVGLSVVAVLVGDPARGAFAGTISFAPASWSGFGAAFIAIMWTYDGWANLTYVAGETRDPGRTLPRALVGGVLVVSVVYLAVNSAFLWILAVPEMGASQLVAADAATRVVGTAGRSLVAALVMLSVLGALNGTVMTTPRVFYAMAADGLFFRRIAAVHPRYKTPHAAIVLSAALGVAYVSIRTFEQLAEAFILGIWPFYALAVWSVIRLRRTRPEVPRSYRTPGYPFVPLLFLLASVGLLGNALVRQPVATLSGFAVILAGIPVFYLWKARARP